MGQGEGVGVGGCAHNLISRRAPNVSPASAGGRRHQWPAACPAHGAGEREQYEPKTPHKTEPLWIPMRIFRSSLFLRLIRLLIGPGVISKCGQCECARPTQHFRGGGYSLYRPDHMQAHLDATLRVLLVGFWSVGRPSGGVLVLLFRAVALKGAQRARSLVATHLEVRLRAAKSGGRAFGRRATRLVWA